MTEIDAAEPQHEAQVQPQEYSSTVLLEPDWFLRTLVNHADYDGMEIGITLTVGGILVSGVLIGGKKYFQHFAKRFASGFADAAMAASLESSFSQYGKLYESQGEHPPRDPVFVHIKDAAFYTANTTPIPSNKGSWWRGRLTEVDGFMLGSLSPS